MNTHAEILQETDELVICKVAAEHYCYKDNIAATREEVEDWWGMEARTVAFIIEGFSKIKEGDRSGVTGVIYTDGAIFAYGGRMDRRVDCMERLLVCIKWGF